MGGIGARVVDGGIFIAVIMFTARATSLRWQPVIIDNWWQHWLKR